MWSRAIKMIGVIKENNPRLQEFANHVKAHAKTGGRNRVAGYAAGIPHSEATLFIFTN